MNTNTKYHTKKILIVEDDKAIRETLSEILENEGYSISQASNGKEGLQKLEADATHSLIVLDLMMPIMDGFAFRNLQMKNPSWSQIPVLVLSADGHIKQKMSKIDGVGYLRKPLDLDEFLNEVQKHFTQPSLG